MIESFEVRPALIGNGLDPFGLDAELVCLPVLGPTTFLLGRHLLRREPGSTVEVAGVARALGGIGLPVLARSFTRLAMFGLARWIEHPDFPPLLLVDATWHVPARARARLAVEGATCAPGAFNGAPPQSEGVAG
jgi:hypothetical protein